MWCGGLCGVVWCWVLPSSEVWHQLDLVVVIMGWLLFLFPSLNNFSAMRTVRVLRPLRTINRVPGMQKLVRSMLGALPQMVNVTAVAAFIFMIFGILGMQLFKGRLHK